MNPHSLGIISATLVIAIVVGLVIDPTWNRYWEIVCIAMLVVGIVGMLTTPPSQWW
jgi:Sec-independent protein secretion pathway component TatC